MKKRNWMITAGTIAALVSGCATTTSKTLDQKLANEPEVSGRQALHTKASDMISGASDLSEAQKAELTSIRNDLRAEIDAYTKESLKLRSVLMKDMLSPDYSAAEVDLIEARLKDVENNRLSAIFGAVDRANKILGRRSIRAELMQNILSEGRSNGT